MDEKRSGKVCGTSASNAWLGLALLDVYRTAGDAAYLGRARAISDWAETHLRYTGTWGGYQGGWYDARLHVGATAWSLIAQTGINPFEIAGHE